MYSQDYIDGQNNGLIVGMTMGLNGGNGNNSDIIGWFASGDFKGVIYPLPTYYGKHFTVSVHHVTHAPLEQWILEPISVKSSQSMQIAASSGAWNGFTYPIGRYEGQHSSVDIIPTSGDLI